VPVPGLDLLTYTCDGISHQPVVGARVLVPVGSRTVTGVVVEIGADLPAGVELAGIKPVRQLLDLEALVPPDVIALARWAAEYYAAGPGDTINAVLPSSTRGDRIDGYKTSRWAAITPAGLLAIAAGTPRQRETLEILSGSPDGLPTSQLASRGISSDTITRLARHGLIQLRRERVERDPFAADERAQADDRGMCAEVRPESGVEVRPADRQLTTEQAAAVARLTTLAERRAFSVALIHGVTGSGKTEVYLKLAAVVLASGRRVLMLVPEIALTPAVLSSFRCAFGVRVAIQHSGLSDGERHDQWQRIRGGAIDVVVGTRSAVFAPLDHLGLIVVDEEHDGSYKQEEIPRYNARDVAIVRAQRADALVVLGSATPSMESYSHAVNGKYERIVLERRVFDRPLPEVTVVDMREEYAAEGPDVILSRALRERLAERLGRGEQSLVLLNRRGFATFVFCRQCTGSLDCPNCSVSLVIHGEGRARRARCHYCDLTLRVPTECPQCHGSYLELSGFGTERVEVEVRQLLAAARVERLDRDAVRRKGSLSALLSRFRRGEIDVLVGTQMIAKGHDFPNVTLCGVVSADVGLGLADFRASERTFQLLTQVAGRAGRGERPGEAIIQTLFPQHYSIQLACRQEYRDFFDHELRFRRAMKYPPAVALISLIVRGRTSTAAMEDAASITERLRKLQGAGGNFNVLGPAPAPLQKLRGEYRAQILIKGVNRRQTRQALESALSARPELRRKVIVDVDPLSVL
jgi:primosomal protein N' (replication factor Y)